MTQDFQISTTAAPRIFRLHLHRTAFISYFATTYNIFRLAQPRPTGLQTSIAISQHMEFESPSTQAVSDGRGRAGRPEEGGSGIVPCYTQPPNYGPLQPAGTSRIHRVPSRRDNDRPTSPSSRCGQLT